MRWAGICLLDLSLSMEGEGGAGEENAIRMGEQKEKCLSGGRKRRGGRIGAYTGRGNEGTPFPSPKGGFPNRDPLLELYRNATLLKEGET